MNQSEFETLAEEDQRSATEIGIAMTILATRIPGMGDSVVDAILDEFAKASKLSKNKLRYVLQEVGRALYERPWRFEAVKTGTSLKTAFDSKDNGENGDGNHEPLQVPTSFN